MLQHRKNVKNGASGGRRRFQAAHRTGHTMATEAWTMPLVNGACSRIPSAKTSRGSVPRSAWMKAAAPLENSRQPLS
jgi:hypothetical protein